jgi:hypothetical protein
MRVSLSLVLFLICYGNIAFSQNDEPIVDSVYKYRIADARVFNNLPHGIYKFNTDIDYIAFMSQYYQEGLFHPQFFKSDEMGIVINYESTSIGSGKKVNAVFETTNYIVIQLGHYSSYIQFNAMNEQQICLALKKSKKEVVIQEVD